MSVSLIDLVCTQLAESAKLEDFVQQVITRSDDLKTKFPVCTKCKLHKRPIEYDRALRFCKSCRSILNHNAYVRHQKAVTDGTAKKMKPREQKLAVAQEVNLSAQN